MLTLTVTDLVLNFAYACRALVPSLDRAAVPWQDEAQYDNWDRVAEALFETLVTEPCVFQAVGEARSISLHPATYGFAHDPGCNAWLAVNRGRPTRVISLASVASPFDHARCEGEPELVTLREHEFVFVYDTGDGLRCLAEVNIEAG